MNTEKHLYISELIVNQKKYLKEQFAWEASKNFNMSIEKLVICWNKKVSSKIYKVEMN